MSTKSTNRRLASGVVYQVIVLETDPAPEIVLETNDAERAMRLARRLNKVEQREPLGTRATVAIKV